MSLGLASELCPTDQTLKCYKHLFVVQLSFQSSMIRISPPLAPNSENTSQSGSENKVRYVPKLRYSLNKHRQSQLTHTIAEYISFSYKPWNEYVRFCVSGP